MKPPCGCKPTNVNALPPAKSIPPRNPVNLLGAFPIRPPLVYSLDASIPNVFLREAPRGRFNLQWTNSANNADPTKQRTPRKKRVPNG